MPRRLQIEFSGVVQKHADAMGGEVSADKIWSLFQNEYFTSDLIKYSGHEMVAKKADEPQEVRLDLEFSGVPLRLIGWGNGLISAVIDAFNNSGLPIDVRDYEEKSLSKGANARAIAFLEMTVAGVPGTHFGVGSHNDTVKAPVMAVISGINRAIKQGKLALPHDFGSQAVRPDGASLSGGQTKPEAPMLVPSH